MSVSFKFTNGTNSSTKAVTLKDMGLSNYAVKDHETETLLTNKTGETIPASEIVKFFSSLPSKSSKMLCGQSLSPGYESFGVIAEGVAFKESDDPSCCCDAAPEPIPMSVTISFKGPHRSDVSADLYETLLVRAFSDLFDATTGHLRITDLRYGITKPESM